ncbi:hypothetical protein NECID01_2146 [Nematocida sp. AWRm77]|nr:hypothetical protein NECID01_2146 [Nematocida sp. AWRm77]
MRKIAVILIHISVAVFCATQIEVDLMLRNETSIRVAVPEGAFKMIDGQEMLFLPLKNSNTFVSEETKTEENIRAVKCEFDSESEYAQFRKLWDIPLPALSAEDSELAQEQTDISAELFMKCLLTANYLDIKGEYAERFAENMVKYGLLGAHSVDIMKPDVLSTYDLSHDTFWSLLQAFVRQMGFEYRITHPSRGYTMLGIRRIDDVWPKNIDQAYTGLSQIEKRRTVLYSELGPTGSQEKRRNEAVLSWLLWNIGGSSVDIQYSMDISSEGLSELRQTIQSFTKESEYGTHTYVEGLTLNVTQQNHASLSTVLQLIPSLSRLELSMSSPSIFFEEISSLFDIISLCKSLKDLKIIGEVLESVAVTKLVESIPTIEKLSFSCKILEGRTIDELKKCTRLESLDINGMYQPSAVVQELVSHLSSLRELRIRCKALTHAAAESFKACKNLEKLIICGNLQPSSALQVLFKHLSFLKELNIRCKPLDSIATERLQACNKLEKLIMYGEKQPSTVVQALVSSLSSLKGLSIECSVIDSTGVENFWACKNMETLVMYGEPQPSASFLIKVLEAAPCLQTLTITLFNVDLPLADALRQCPNLRSLWLTTIEYTPGFLEHYLQPSLPKLKTLTLYNSDRNNNYSEEDNRAVENAWATGIKVAAL